MNTKKVAKDYILPGVAFIAGLAGIIGTKYVSNSMEPQPSQTVETLYEMKDEFKSIDSVVESNLTLEQSDALANLKNDPKLITKVYKLEQQYKDQTAVKLAGFAFSSLLLAGGLTIGVGNYKENKDPMENYAK